jgi:glucan 1,3-beta-glucosidase
MRFSRLVMPSAFILSVASHTFEIPQVKAIVDDIMAKVEEYVHFDGNETGTIEKRQSSSYWYENIPHRGISAFGPQGYAVYRNVKDFGARGKHP